MKTPGFLVSFYRAAATDAVLEWRNPSGVLAMVLLALISTMIYHYALPAVGSSGGAHLRGLMLALLFFAAYVTPGRSRVREREGAADAVIGGSAADPSAVFLGKALIVWQTQVVGTIFFVPAFHILLSGALPTESGTMPREIGILALAAMSLAALGVLLARISDGNRLRDILLPLILLPASLPVFILASDAMNLEADPAGRAASVGALAFAGIAYIAAGSFLYPVLTSEK